MSALRPQRPSVPSRYCWNCSHCLDHVSEPRCPRCGERFDRDDPSTWRSEPFEPGNDRLLEIGLGVFMFGSIALVVIGLAVAFVWSSAG